MRIPLFAELKRQRRRRELQALAELVNLEEFEQGQWLFKQGERGTRLYYILEGVVRLVRIDREGLTRYVRDMQPGDSVGETALLVGDVHDTSAEALTPVKVLYLEREGFRSFLEQNQRVRRLLKVSPQLRQRLETPEFKWLREDELVVFSERRHWIYLLRRTTLPIFLLFILFPLVSVLLGLGGPIATVFAVLVGILLLAIVGWIVWEYLNWRDDVFVLTTERIVHYERTWPVRESMEEAPLGNLEDINVIQSSFLANTLGFGDIILQTAGETVEIDLTGVRRPMRLRELIFREIERNQAQDVITLRSKIRDKLERRLRSEDLPPPPEPEPPSTVQPPRKGMILPSALKDYFFPPSWMVGRNQQTVYCHRYWLPGFIRNLHIILPFFIVTVAGLWLIVGAVITAGFLSWFLALWLFLEAVLFAIMLWQLEDWRNDYFEITPSRVILVFQKPMLLEEIRQETRLDRIQNISYEVPNVLARLLKYGHVMLETAGETGRYELKWVRYPQELQGEISRRQREFRERQREAEAQRREEDLLNWFDVY
ncbi:MAG: cyclic nucleotide-binding domain-containing protein, partial [Anaerolineae bacterium]